VSQWSVGPLQAHEVPINPLGPPYAAYFVLPTNFSVMHSNIIVYHATWAAHTKIYIAYNIQT